MSVGPAYVIFCSVSRSSALQIRWSNSNEPPEVYGFVWESVKRCCAPGLGRSKATSSWWGGWVCLQLSSARESQLFSLIRVKLYYQEKNPQTKLDGTNVWVLVMQYFRQGSYTKVVFSFMVDCIAFIWKLKGLFPWFIFLGGGWGGWEEMRKIILKINHGRTRTVSTLLVFCWILFSVLSKFRMFAFALTLVHRNEWVETIFRHTRSCFNE